MAECPANPRPPARLDVPLDLAKRRVEEKVRARVPSTPVEKSKEKKVPSKLTNVEMVDRIAVTVTPWKPQSKKAPVTYSPILLISPPPALKNSHLTEEEYPGRLGLNPQKPINTWYSASVRGIFARPKAAAVLCSFTCSRMCNRVQFQNVN